MNNKRWGHSSTLSGIILLPPLPCVAPKSWPITGTISVGQCRVGLTHGEGHHGWKRGDRPEPSHTPNPGVRLPTAHWLRWTGRRPGRLSQRTQNRLSLPHWRGGGYMGWPWVGPVLSGTPRGPPHQRNQVRAQYGPYTSPVADRPFTATSAS